MNEERQPSLRPVVNGALELTLRSRVRPFRGLDEWHEVVVRESYPVSETALLLCDVWNKHCYDGATQRVNEMAPRMEKVAQRLRERGVQIVHAPSDTMDFYEGTEQRLRLLVAPLASCVRQVLQKGKWYAPKCREVVRATPRIGLCCWSEVSV